MNSILSQSAALLAAITCASAQEILHPVLPVPDGNSAQVEHALVPANLQVEVALAQAGGGVAVASGDGSDHVLEYGGPLDLVLSDNGPFNIPALSKSVTPPLVIGGADQDAETLAAIREDLTVMARILNKAIEQSGGRERSELAMGIALHTLGGAPRPQTIYLDGYGALFLLNVRFPLMPPAVKKEAEDAAPDTDWEKTKRELFGPREATRSWAFSANAGPKVEYKEEKVEQLKEEIIQSLKNASNIRHLAPDDSIVVAVSGSSGGSAAHAGHAIRLNTVVRKSAGSSARSSSSASGSASSSDDASKSPKVVAVKRADDAAAFGGSTMVIRVRKADVDAFAKGKIDDAAFEKKVSIRVY
ncbi:MAG: hypothetical protein AB1813_01640 [Verrucomicrobiota bacterium]